MTQKINAYCAANDITGTGGPRFARPSKSGKPKFFGIHLPSDKSSHLWPSQFGSPSGH